MSDYDDIVAADGRSRAPIGGEAVEWAWQIVDKALDPDHNRVMVDIHFDADHDNMGRTEEKVDPQFKWKSYVVTVKGKRRAKTGAHTLEYVNTQTLGADGSFTGPVHSTLTVDGSTVEALESWVPLKDKLNKRVEEIKTKHGLHPIGVPGSTRWKDFGGSINPDILGHSVTYVNDTLNKNYYGFHAFWLAYDGLVNASDSHHEKRIDYYRDIRKKVEKGTTDYVTLPAHGSKQPGGEQSQYYHEMEVLKKTLGDLEKKVEDEQRLGDKRDHAAIEKMEKNVSKLRSKMDAIQKEMDEKEVPSQELQRHLEQVEEWAAEDLAELEHIKGASSEVLAFAGLPNPSPEIQKMVQWFIDQKYRSKPDPRGWLTAQDFGTLVLTYGRHMDQMIDQKIKEISSKKGMPHEDKDYKNKQIDVLKGEVAAEKAKALPVFEAWPADLKRRRDESRKSNQTEWEQKYNKEELEWVDDKAHVDKILEHSWHKVREKHEEPRQYGSTGMLKHYMYQDLRDWFKVELAQTGVYGEALKAVKMGFVTDEAVMGKARQAYKDALKGAEHAMMSMEGLLSEEKHKDWNTVKENYRKKYGPHAEEYLVKLNKLYGGETAKVETSKAIHASEGDIIVEAAEEDEGPSIDKDEFSKMKNMLDKEIMPAFRKAEALLRVHEKIPVLAIARAMYEHVEAVSKMFSKVKSSFLFSGHQKPTRFSEVNYGLDQVRLADDESDRKEQIKKIADLEDLRDDISTEAKLVSGMTVENVKGIPNSIKELTSMLRTFVSKVDEAFPRQTTHMEDERMLKNVMYYQHLDAPKEKSTGGAPKVVKPPTAPGPGKAIEPGKKAPPGGRKGLPVEMPYMPFPQEKGWTRGHPKTPVETYPGTEGEGGYRREMRKAAFVYDKVCDTADYLQSSEYVEAATIGEVMQEKAEAGAPKEKEQAKETLHKLDIKFPSSKLSKEMGDIKGLLEQLSQPGEKDQNGRILRNDTQAKTLHQQASEEYDHLLKHHQKSFEDGFTEKRIEELSNKWKMSDKDKVVKRLTWIKTELAKKAFDEFFMRWHHVEKSGSPRKEKTELGNRPAHQYETLMEKVKSRVPELFEDHPEQDEEADYVKPKKKKKPSAEAHARLENYIINNYDREYQKAREDAVKGESAERRLHEMSGDDEGQAEQMIDEMIDDVYGSKSPYGDSEFEEVTRPGGGGASKGKNRRTQQQKPEQPRYVPGMYHAKIVEALKAPVGDTKFGVKNLVLSEMNSYLANLKQEVHRLKPGQWIDPHDVVDCLVFILKKIAYDVRTVKCLSRYKMPTGTKYKLQAGEIVIDNKAQADEMKKRMDALFSAINHYIAPNVDKKEMGRGDLTGQEDEAYPESFHIAVKELSEKEMPGAQLTPERRKEMEQHPQYQGYKPLREGEPGVEPVKRTEPFHGRSEIELPGSEGVKVDPDAKGKPKDVSEKDQASANRKAIEVRKGFEAEYNKLVDTYKTEYAHAQVNLNKKDHDKSVKDEADQNIDYHVQNHVTRPMQEIRIKNELHPEVHSKILNTGELPKFPPAFNAEKGGKLHEQGSDAILTKFIAEPGKESKDKITQAEYKEGVAELKHRPQPGNKVKAYLVSIHIDPKVAEEIATKANSVGEDLSKLETEDLGKIDPRLDYIQHNDKDPKPLLTRVQYDKLQSILKRYVQVINVAKQIVDAHATGYATHVFKEQVKGDIHKRLQGDIHNRKVNELKEQGSSYAVDKATAEMKPKVQKLLDEVKAAHWSNAIAQDYGYGWDASTLAAYKVALLKEIDENLVFWRKKKASMVYEKIEKTSAERVIEASTKASVVSTKDPKIPMGTRIASQFVGTEEDGALYQ